MYESRDADTVDVGLHLVVPQLHVGGGLQDLVRPVARAAGVRRRAIDGTRQDHDGGLVEGGPHRQGATEDESFGVVVVERNIHG
jgi:hypothetical protein